MNLQVKVKTWGRLVRLPNLLTVPGDVLAGFILAASTGTSWPVHPGLIVVASMLFYMAGLLINDLVDMEADRQERPGRPLPSGMVSRRAVKHAAGLAMGVALVLLGWQGPVLLGSGILLGLLVLVYNVPGKRHRLVGSSLMGACRAANIGLGVVAVSPPALIRPEILLVLGWWLLYIGAVSWLAARETRATTYGPERWLPLAIYGCGVLFVMLLAYGAVDPRSQFRAVMCAIFAAVVVFQSTWSLNLPKARPRNRGVRRPPPMTLYPSAIGGMISALIPMQACLLILFGRDPWVLLAALLLLLAWPLNRWWARSFAPS